MTSHKTTFGRRQKFGWLNYRIIFSDENTKAWQIFINIAA